MLFVGVLAALGCSLDVRIPGGTSASPSPGATTVPAPASPQDEARETAQKYLQAWQRREYQAMYDLISRPAKETIAPARFVGRYQAIASGAAITQVAGQAGDLRLFPSATNPISATVTFSVTMQSARVGQIDERNALPLVREDGRWRVAWTPELIFRDLGGDNVVRLDPEEPARGVILDRKGRTLAGPGKIASVGLVPGNLKDEAKALQGLSAFLGLPAAAIKAKYANAKPDWWVPLRDLPDSRRGDALAKLAGIDGVEVRSENARVYPNGKLAAHVLGYVAPISAEDLANLAAQGYEEGDFIGRAGLEAWAERELAGQKGGRLLIADADGDTVRVIAQRKARAGATVQLTVDLDVQQQAEQALGDKVGSVVVIDPRDNSILAMVSHPAFDPNAFVTGISDEDWQRLSTDPRHPFQNRASLSAYPTGSIFKVITMAAGLEKGGYRPDSPFDCNGRWTGLPGVAMGDWKPEGHGRLDLQEGLVESCDIVFYELGKKLDSLNGALLADFARQFGLGEPTGVTGLIEASGTVPDPDWKQRSLKQPWYPGDGVNLAIGQGYLEATPLQMANLYAALANGGELRTPVLVRRVGEGGTAREYAAQPRRRLPASPATLATIREAMKKVAASPKGTANYAFRGFRVSTAAKTGSAENQNPDAHAWFAGYAPADSPEIVALVMVEGGRAGGEVAAPLARQIMESYFNRR